MFITTLGLPITIGWLISLFVGIFAINKRPSLRKPVIAVLVAIPVLAILLGFLLG
ncbi:MAG: hypothetical protein ACOVMF_01455 [Aquiluna sp.]|jgi:hypothetical protein